MNTDDSAEALAGLSASSSAVAIPFLEVLRGQVEQRRVDGGNLAVLLIEAVSQRSFLQWAGLS